MKKLLKGNRPDIIDANVRTLKEAGYDHGKAVRCAMCHANKKHDHKSKTIAKKITKKAPIGVTVK